MAASRTEHDLGVATERFRTRLVVIAAVSVALDLLAAAGALVAERGAPHAFSTYWDALFFTTTQLLTISSSLPNPEHPAAKVLDVAMELYAVVVVSSLAGTFADLLHHRTHHRSERLWRETR